MINNRQKVELSETRYVVGCFSTGLILDEAVDEIQAKKILRKFKNGNRTKHLDCADIYTREDWEQGFLGSYF